ncbi:MAG: hypothetical protein ACW987_17075 [Candidatus Thorarchaeota archaeon]|jgi:hypothetical protein
MMPDEELNEIRQLIDSMQSGLVELFDQLRDLRTRLNLVSDSALETVSTPAVLPLFSEVKSPSLDTPVIENSDESDITQVAPTVSDEPPMEIEESDAEQTASSAKVNRVLDPISHELRTGEAPAEIIYEYLQSAREYLIDDASDKGKVARDIDIVLNFLKARGNKTIRPDERDNILKRIRRWKAHLVVQSSSPAD